jgi:hypothetical protein
MFATNHIMVGKSPVMLDTKQNMVGKLFNLDKYSMMLGTHSVMFGTKAIMLSTSTIMLGIKPMAMGTNMYTIVYQPQ